MNENSNSAPNTLPSEPNATPKLRVLSSQSDASGTAGVAAEVVADERADEALCARRARERDDEQDGECADHGGTRLNGTTDQAEEVLRPAFFMETVIVWLLRPEACKNQPDNPADLTIHHRPGAVLEKSLRVVACGVRLVLGLALVASVRLSVSAQPQSWDRTCGVAARLLAGNDGPRRPLKSTGWPREGAPCSA